MSIRLRLCDFNGSRVTQFFHATLTNDAMHQRGPWMCVCFMAWWNHVWFDLCFCCWQMVVSTPLMSHNQHVRHLVCWPWQSYRAPQVPNSNRFLFSCILILISCLKRPPWSHNNKTPNLKKHCFLKKYPKKPWISRTRSSLISLCFKEWLNIPGYHRHADPKKQKSLSVAWEKAANNSANWRSCCKTKPMGHHAMGANVFGHRLLNLERRILCVFKSLQIWKYTCINLYVLQVLRVLGSFKALAFFFLFQSHFLPANAIAHCLLHKPWLDEPFVEQWNIER